MDNNPIMMGMTLSERMLRQTAYAVFHAAKESPDPLGEVYTILKRWLDGKDELIDQLYKLNIELSMLQPPAPIIINRSELIHQFGPAKEPRP